MPSQSVQNILSYLPRLHTLSTAEKERLYTLLDRTSSHDLAYLYDAGELQVLTHVLSQPNTTCISSRSKHYVAAEILALYFWQNTSYRAFIQDTVHQHEINNPQPNAILFLEHLAYDSVLQTVLNKTMHHFSYSKVTSSCTASITLLNKLILARNHLLITYDTKRFHGKIQHAIQDAYDADLLDASTYGSVKRFFTLTLSLKQQLIGVMQHLPDAKKAVRMEHINELNARRAALVNPPHEDQAHPEQHQQTHCSRAPT